MHDCTQILLSQHNTKIDQLITAPMPGPVSSFIKNVFVVAWLPLLLVPSVGAQPNSLNMAISAAVTEMNTNDVFADKWVEYFGGIPVPIPDCTSGEFVPVDSADVSLTGPLNAGVLKIGVSRVAVGFPSIFSNSSDAMDPTDVDAGDLAGYEIDCSREATRVLGVAYAIDLQPDYVFLGGSFFDPLLEALNNDTVDVVWTGMVVNDDREAVLDFTCPNIATDYVIGTGPGVSGVPPDVDGPDVPVACIAVFCTLSLPAPFVLTEIDGGLTALTGVLTNTTDPFDYAMGTSEQHIRHWHSSVGYNHPRSFYQASWCGHGSPNFGPDVGPGGFLQLESDYCSRGYAF